MPKLNTNDLEPNSIFMIRGKVSFSRITRFMTPEEFNAENQRRVQGGRITLQTPIAHITLSQCCVICNDPNNKTTNEMFAEQKLYARPTAPETGYNYTAQQTGQFTNLPDGRQVAVGTLPSVWIQDGTGNFQQIKPEGELANGLDVIVVMRVYKSRSKPNNGVSFDRILVMEPIRYYSGNPNLFADLAKYGLTFNADPSIDTRVTAESYGVAAPAAPVPAPGQTAAAMPAAPAAPVAPSYAPVAPVAPPSNPFSTQPAAPVAPAPAAPVAPAMPAAPVAPAAPIAPTAPIAPAAPVAPAAPAPFGVPPTTFPNGAAAPVAPTPAPGGIVGGYDPNNDPQRQY